MKPEDWKEGDLAEVIDVANLGVGTPSFKVGDIGKVNQVVGCCLNVEIGNEKHKGWKARRFKFLARPSDLQDIEIDLSAYQGDERAKVSTVIQEFLFKCKMFWAGGGSDVRVRSSLVTGKQQLYHSLEMLWS